MLNVAKLLKDPTRERPCPDCERPMAPIALPMPEDLRECLGLEASFAPTLWPDRCPACAAEFERRRMIEAAVEREHAARDAMRIPRSLADATFETFRCAAPDDRARDRQRRALAGVESFTRMAADASFDRWGMLLGPNGSGKSHLAAAAVRHAVDLGLSAEFWTERDLVAAAKAAWQADSTEEAFVAARRRVRLLVVDDLGETNERAKDRARVREILAARADDFAPTLITTNLADEQWSEILGPRLISRMRQRCHGRIWSLQDVPDWRDPRNGVARSTVAPGEEEAR